MKTTPEYDRWYQLLNPEAQKRVNEKVNLIAQYGFKLSRPHADVLGTSKFANMKELRVNTSDGQVLRIAFAFDKSRQPILLTGGDKAGVSSDQFYRKLIKQADGLFEVHNAKVDKKLASLHRRRMRRLASMLFNEVVSSIGF